MRLAEFRKSAGRARWMVTVWPVVSQVTGQRFFVPFPAMGDYSAPWAAAATIITGLIGLIPFVSLPKEEKKIIRLLLSSIGCFAVYLTLSQIFTVSVPRPAGLYKHVIRGSVRQTDLPRADEARSDESLIEDSGQDDAALEDIYQAWSLQLNRQAIFWTYVLSWGLFQASLGSIAALDHQRPVGSKAQP